MVPGSWPSSALNDSQVPGLLAPKKQGSWFLGDWATFDEKTIPETAKDRINSLREEMCIQNMKKLGIMKNNIIYIALLVFVLGCGEDKTSEPIQTIPEVPEIIKETEYYS